MLLVSWSNGGNGYLDTEGKADSDSIHTERGNAGGEKKHPEDQVGVETCVRQLLFIHARNKLIYGIRQVKKVGNSFQNTGQI